MAVSCALSAQTSRHPASSTTTATPRTNVPRVTSPERTIRALTSAELLLSSQSAHQPAHTSLDLLGRIAPLAALEYVQVDVQQRQQCVGRVDAVVDRRVTCRHRALEQVQHHAMHP